MAEGKKSFVLYADIASIVDELPREIKGDLFQMIIDYVNDRNPKTDDLLLKTAFMPIKLQLKRDLQRWEETREKRSLAGKASANKRQQVSTHVQSVQQNSTSPTVTVNDTVTVNVNDIYIKDFENTGAFETIQRQTGLSKEYLKSQIKNFIPKMNVDYKDFNSFANHFKSWVLKNKELNQPKKLPKELK